MKSRHGYTGGTLSTAGNLVFDGSVEGTFSEGRAPTLTTEEMKEGTMTLRSLIRISAVFAVGTLTAWITIANYAKAQQAKKVDNNALRSAAKNGDEWVTYGRDYAETHYSPLKQIDTTNVSVWAWHGLGNQSPAGAEWKRTSDVERSDVRQLGWDVLFAMDARTGKLKWRWDPEIARRTSRESAAGP